MRDAGWCFACGPENPIGLRLRFVSDGDEVRAEFALGPEYQGYEGVLHGGIVTAALDDAMANLVHLHGQEAVIACLDVRFRRPAPVGQRLVVRARVRRARGRIFTAEAVLALPDGTRLADAQGTFVRGG